MKHLHSVPSSIRPGAVACVGRRLQYLSFQSESKPLVLDDRASLHPAWPLEGEQLARVKLDDLSMGRCRCALSPMKSRTAFVRPLYRGKPQVDEAPVWNW